jgi:hypothetical protein
MAHFQDKLLAYFDVIKLSTRRARYMMIIDRH